MWCSTRGGATPVFIPTLLGVEPDGQPWAELWLGTHPNGPSHLGDGRPLSELTGDLPVPLEGPGGGRAAVLQTHPNVEQARAGHARGYYLDPNPKPELLCALTPFEAFCGVRPVDDTLALLHELDLAIAHADG